MKKLFILGLLVAATSAPATIIQFQLLGSGGPGLRFNNEPGVLTGGTGNEASVGIRFNDVSKFLELNVGWGSANAGYLDMTGPSTNAHLHQVANPFGNDGTNDFVQTGAVVVQLQMDTTNFITSSSASNGFITGGRVLSPAEESLLLANRLYLNVHSIAQPNGEMRGFLVPEGIPEPATALFGMTALGALVLRRRRA